MPTASGKTIREIVDLCTTAGLQTKIVPGLYELIGGAVSVSQLRPVQIEDLLRRAPVQTDIAAVAGLLAGKRVLVTGGGGSIGSELCRQIIRLQTANGKWQMATRNAWNCGARNLQSAIVPIIAGIRFPERLAAVFAEQRPEIVFHAAVLPSVANTCR